MFNEQRIWDKNYKYFEMKIGGKDEVYELKNSRNKRIIINVAKIAL